jgi:hypothetical protein
VLHASQVGVFRVTPSDAAACKNQDNRDAHIPIKLPMHSGKLLKRLCANLRHVSDLAGSRSSQKMNGIAFPSRSSVQRAGSKYSTDGTDRKAL